MRKKKVYARKKTSVQRMSGYNLGSLTMITKTLCIIGIRNWTCNANQDGRWASSHLPSSLDLSVCSGCHDMLTSLEGETSSYTLASLMWFCIRYWCFVETCTWWFWLYLPLVWRLQVELWLVGCTWWNSSQVWIKTLSVQSSKGWTLRYTCLQPCTSGG